MAVLRAKPEALTDQRAPLAYAGECEQTRADEAPRCWLGGCGSTLDADG